MNIVSTMQGTLDMRLSIGDQAPPLTLQNQAGEQINTANIWHKGTTVLTFLRHFG